MINTFAIEARPHDSTSAKMNLEDDLLAVTVTVAGFESASHTTHQVAASCWRASSRWRKARGVGIGFQGGSIPDELRLDDEVIPYVVDINPKKQGSYLPGTAQQIVHPASSSTIAHTTSSS